MMRRQGTIKRLSRPGWARTVILGLLLCCAGCAQEAVPASTATTVAPEATVEFSHRGLFDDVATSGPDAPLFKFGYGLGTLPGGAH